MKSIFIILFIFSHVVSAQNVQLLLKLDQKGLYKKLATNQVTGVAAVDEVLRHVPDAMVKPLFSKYTHHHLAQWITIEVPKKQSQQMLERLSQIAQVEAVTENRAFHVTFSPDDARMDEQWALDKIRARDAWDIQRGSPDVLIAIIDTGVDYSHPDLQGNIWINAAEDLNGNGIVDAQDFNGVDDDANGFVDDVQGWDFTDAPNYPDGSDYLLRDNDPMDEFGHGTGAAGLVAGVADNSMGIAGLAHGCRIMNLRAFNGSGYGEEDDVASAILYAIENGASIINMSFGDVFVSRVIEDVVRYGVEQGVIMIASAGNASNDFIHYPSGFEGVMSIGSTDAQDERSSFSNFGPSIDLYAPGTSVLSTTLNAEYKNWNGTSFAAPYVAGAAALLVSQYPDLSAEAVRGILVNSTDFIHGASSWNSDYSHGRLNVYNALTAPRESVVRIQQPALDAGYSSPHVPIIGSVWSPDFSSYSIYYGEGNNPEQWNVIAESIATPVIQDTLLLWHSDLLDGEYTLRLEVQNRDNSTEQVTTRFFIDSTPPQISDTRVLPMYDAANPAALIEFQSDDLATGIVHVRHEQLNGEFDMLLENYRTYEPRVLFTQDEHFGVFDSYVSAKNGAGLVSVDDKNGDYYEIDLSEPEIAMNTFSKSGLQVQFGRMLEKNTDFNQNGVAEIAVSQSADGAIGPIMFYEMQDGVMQQLYQTDTALIPRDVGDTDGDGKQELLAGYGFSSWLYEAPAHGEFPTQLIQDWSGDGATQYWAAAITDADQDGKGEVIMRVIRNDGTSTDQYEIFESSGDNQFEQVAVLPNFTKGENFYGVPHVEIGDFDDDGQSEILIGDSDGDIFIYENIADNQYQATWQARLPLLDAIDYICTGDFDGDGVPEFAAGSHSDANLNTEHFYDARHWHYQLYDRTGNDQFSMQDEWRFFGFESPSDFLSSVNSGDVDGDGADELLITVFPDFYIIDYQQTHYKPVFYAAGAQNSGIAVADFNSNGRNEFWLGDGKYLSSFVNAAFSLAPPAPANLTAFPLNESKVQLQWLPGQADFYSVFRSADNAVSLQKIAETTEPFFLDSDVQQNVIYYYAVYAHDLSADPQISLASRTVSARPGTRPKLIDAQCESAKTLRLYFDKPINNSLKSVRNFTLDNSLYPTSVAVYASGQQALLSFEELLNTGTHHIQCHALFDAYHIPIDTAFSALSFNTPDFPGAFYLLSAQFTDVQHIQLQFSDELDGNSAQIANHYEIDEWTVTSATATDDRVLLTVEKQHNTANPQDVTVRVKNIKSAEGVTIKTGLGDVLNIPTFNTAAGEFTVYPNPWMPNYGTAFITFTQLEKDDAVKIYTISGAFVEKILAGDNGIAQWNIEQEKNIAPGIYIYYIAKLNKIGKCAVIR